MRAMITTVWGIYDRLNQTDRENVYPELIAEITLYAMSGLDASTIIGIEKDNGRIIVTKCACNGKHKGCYHCLEGKPSADEIIDMVHYICDNVDLMQAIPTAYFDGVSTGKVSSNILDQDSVMLLLREDS